MSQSVCLYELTGIISRTDKKNNLLTIISVTTKKTYQVECSFFCPARRGDVIIGYCLEDNTGKLKFVQEPIVEPPSSKEAVQTAFIIALRGTRFGRVMADKLYRFFENEAKERIKRMSFLRLDPVIRNRDTLPAAIMEIISMYACNFRIDETTAEPLRQAGLNKEQAEKLLRWWYYSLSLRRLYLLGLTRREIRESCERGWTPSTLYYQLIENPYVAERIPLEKARSISNRYRLNLGQDMDESGYLIRFVDNQTLERGWSCYPVYALMKKHSRFSELYPILERHFRCTIRYNFFYLHYQAEAEDTLTRFLQPAELPQTYCSTQTKENLSEEQVVAVEQALNNTVSVITGKAGTGKCLHPNTPILLFNGRIKLAKKIRVGDQLMGDDSKPRLVKSICQGQDEMFKIIPETGQGFICNLDHVLTLKKGDSVLDIPLREYLKRPKRDAFLFRVGVDFPEQRTDLDPYLFGLKLKDRTIPECYKVNSRENRIKLLLGILSQGKPSWSKDLEFVVQSLGLSYKDLPVQFRFRIESLGKGEYCGFTLDGNGRFLLGNFIVTHNTTVISAIADELNLRNEPYLIASFTGKAVSRIKEVVRRKDLVWTLHMILNRSLRSSVRSLIVDEASMVTNELLARVLNKLTPSRLVLVGDAGQIQPIDWGDLFNQLFLVSNVPTSDLTVNYRCKREGILQRNVQEFAPDKTFEWGSDCQFIEGGIPEIESIVKSLHSQGVPHAEITIICPFNRDLEDINRRCQEIFLDKNAPVIADSFGKVWKLGARVMMTVNRYDIDVMNGEEGIISGIYPERQEIRVNFKNSEETIPTYLRMEFTEEDEPEDIEEPLSTKLLVLSWAITIHKSQGSEWKYVIFYLAPGNAKSGFINRKLVYTGVSRAKRVLYIVAESESAFLSTLGVDPPKRYDNLAKRLSGEEYVNHYINPMHEKQRTILNKNSPSN